MMIEIILLFVFGILLFNYLLFLSGIIKGLKNLSDKDVGKIPDEFISVIIPFRNESENIIKSLTSIVAQDYPPEKYEVIYVNDSSTDNSYEKLLNITIPDNVRVISLPDFSLNKAFKKKAISYGIEQSLGEIIVTTDADCIHNSSWLTKLLSEFDDNTGFVSGPVSFIPEENLFSKIQSIEFAGLVLSGAGLIGIGKPTICNGANLAFRKRVYNKLGGYQDHMHLSSGEDELLMQKIVSETDYSVKFSWKKQVVVFTQPNKSLNVFFQQRKRWASKGLFYKNKLLIINLILIYLFYLSLLIQIILSIFVSNVFLISLLVSLISKFLLEYIIIIKGIDFLFNRSLLKNILLSEIFQIIYIPLASLGGIFGNFKWKERKLNR